MLIAGAGTLAICAAINAIQNPPGSSGASLPSIPTFGPGDLGIPDWAFSDGGSAEDPEDEPSGTAGSDGEAGGSTSVNDIVGGSNFDRETSKGTKIYDREGGFEQAVKDFDGLDLENASNKGNDVRVGDLPSGDKVIVRPNSSDGRPTLEVQNSNGKTKMKIRYN